MTKLLKYPGILIFCLLSIAAPGKPSNVASRSQQIAQRDTTKKLFSKSRKPQNPGSATRAAIFPGGGQFYNGDFWKLPIVYASLAGSIYSFHLNSLKYHDFLKGYLSFYDLTTGQLAQGVKADTRMPVVVRNLLNTQSGTRSFTRDQIVRQKDGWRRYRNLSILTTGLVYFLSIIEANVAAHLKSFDISDDLTMQLSPCLNQFTPSRLHPGVQVVISFR